MRLLARSTISVLTMAASVGLVACGGGDDGDGEEQIVPEGDHHHYVVDSVTVPTTNEQATQLSFNLDNPDATAAHPNECDDAVDNQLGRILTTLATLSDSFDIQGSITESVDQGEILLLADVQATSLTAASNVGFSIFIGENPSPAACADENDLICRGHLMGDATFDVGSTTGAQVGGHIVNSTFETANTSGSLQLQIALGGGDPINLSLVRAQARVSGITDGELGNAIVAGGILEEDLDSEVLPAIAETIAGIVAEDCTPAGADCGCVADSTGETLLGFLDADEDCEVTVTEIKEHDVLSSLLAPDICVDGDDIPDALSVGVGATAVGATFDQP